MNKIHVNKMYKTMCTHIGQIKKSSRGRDEAFRLKSEEFRAKIAARDRLAKEERSAKLQEEADEKKRLRKEARAKDKPLHGIKKDRKAYERAYREANRERLKERDKLRYEESKDHRKDKNKAYREAHKEIIKEKRKVYDEGNKEKRAAYHERNADRRKLYYEMNKERIKAYYRLYIAAKRAEYAARTIKRKALKLKATPVWSDLNKITKIYRCCKQLSEITGVKHHVDHIVPLKGKTVCGLHVEYNLRIITATENLGKGNRLIL